MKPSPLAKINWPLISILTACVLFWACAVPYLIRLFVGLVITIGSLT